MATLTRRELDSIIEEKIKDQVIVSSPKVVKPGYKTTEFWIGLCLPTLVGLLLAAGVITPESAEQLTSQIAEGGDIVGEASPLIARAMGLVAMIVPATKYMKSRAKAKNGNYK